VSDTVEAIVPTDAELARVRRLAELQRSQTREVVRITRELVTALNLLRQTREVDLPEAMRDVGLSEVKLLDGTPVKVEDKLTGTKLTSPVGLGYVEENGGARLIKTAIVVELDRGDLAAAREVYQDLRSHKKANLFKRLELEEHVHQSTIAAFVRELIAKGKDVPLERLGVHRRVTAIVGARPKSVELAGLTEEELPE